MKKIFVLPVLCLLLCGCSTMQVSRLTEVNRKNLARLSLDMDKDRALAVMGKSHSIYHCDRGVSKQANDVIVDNPYRTEKMQLSGRTLEIIYYVTDFKNDNCMIDNEELTPLVFENSKLIGWGNIFLSKIASDIKQDK